MKFEATRSWSKRSERDGEVHEVIRPIANCDDSRIWLSDSARLELFFGDQVDDVPLLPGFIQVGLVDGANDVDLIIFRWMIAGVHVNDVVSLIDSEDRVRGVPVDVVNLGSENRVAGDDQCDEKSRPHLTVFCHF